MQAQEWTNVDKADWTRGVWDEEPDKAQWTDEKTGLPCLVVRGPSGALCGYVGVSSKHPWYEIDYSICTTQCGEDWCEHSPGCRIDVHGGLTFSSKCAETNDPSKHICHVVDAGEDDDVWWFGFDCAHYGDLCPKYEHQLPYSWDDWYKDFGYVKGQVAKLAGQLASVGDKQ